MHRLKVQLVDRLGRNELHRRALHGFGNGLRVTEVILLFLRIRPNVSRRHQPSIVAIWSWRLRWCAPTQASMPIRHGGIFANRASTWPRDHFCRSTMAPRPSRPTTWNEFLPMSMPTKAILRASAMACSLSLVPRISITCCWGGSTAGPSHYRTWPGNFAVTHKTLPFGDVLECL